MSASGQEQSSRNVSRRWPSRALSRKPDHPLLTLQQRQSRFQPVVALAFPPTWTLRTRDVSVQVELLKKRVRSLREQGANIRSGSNAAAEVK